MLKERARLIENSLFVLDILITILMFFVAYRIRFSLKQPDLMPIMPLGHYLNLLLIIIPTWALVFRLSKVYRSYRTSTIFREVITLLRTMITCGIILGFCIFFLKDFFIISRLFFLFFLILNTLSLVFIRILVRSVARYVRRLGYNSRYMIVVGDDQRALDFAKMVDRTGVWGYKIKGFVALDKNSISPEIERYYKVLGDIDDLMDLVLHEVVDDVVFLVSRKKLDELEDLFLFLEDVGVNTRVAMNFFPNVIARTYITSLKGVPLLSFSTIPGDGFPLIIKTIMDKILSAFLLLILSPITLSAALLIKITSRGPIIWTQTRCGLNGRKFTLYKFRSMVNDAEEKKKNLSSLNEMDGPVFKIKNDPRITSVGRWLRKTSIDEIPQLINVLKGDMSLVGPRPALPAEVEQYERWQRRRLSMKPGLTCLWQVQGRNRIDFERWMKMDLDYIDNWRLELDLKILLKTIPVVLSCNGM